MRRPWSTTARATRRSGGRTVLVAILVALVVAGLAFGLYRLLGPDGGPGERADGARQRTVRGGADAGRCRPAARVPSRQRAGRRQPGHGRGPESRRGHRGGSRHARWWPRSMSVRPRPRSRTTWSGATWTGCSRSSPKPASSTSLPSRWRTLRPTPTGGGARRGAGGGRARRPGAGHRGPLRRQCRAAGHGAADEETDEPSTDEPRPRTSRPRTTRGRTRTTKGRTRTTRGRTRTARGRTRRSDERRRPRNPRRSPDGRADRGRQRVTGRRQLRRAFRIGERRRAGGARGRCGPAGNLSPWSPSQRSRTPESSSACPLRAAARSRPGHPASVR